MKTLVLQRQPPTLQGTKGLFYGEGFSALSIELPWFQNRSGISSIPAGRYKCTFTYSPRYKRKMYLVEAVPKRSGIRIHSASYAGSTIHGYKADLLGCIALGSKYVGPPGQEILVGSRNKIKEFEKFMQGEDFLLEIIDAKEQ